MLILNAVGEILIFNLLKPGGYFMFQQVQLSESLHGPENAFHAFFMNLTTNSNFYYILHEQIGFCN